MAYCRRTSGKPKKRKRSCTQCHRAKAKCSFEPQVSVERDHLNSLLIKTGILYPSPSLCQE